MIDYSMLINEKNLKNIIIAGIDDSTKCPCIGSIFIAGVGGYAPAPLPVMDPAKRPTL